jgi:hypothetical protein
MRRKVVDTKYIDMFSGGRRREGMELILECGHHVDRLYSHRRSFTHANCEWCNRERNEGVRYVYAYDQKVRSFYHVAKPKEGEDQCTKEPIATASAA